MKSIASGQLQGLRTRVAVLCLTVLIPAAWFLLVWGAVPSTRTTSTVSTVSELEVAGSNVHELHVEIILQGQKLSSLLLPTRPLMKDPSLSFHPRVPRLVYEENPAWHSNSIPSWTTPYAIASRHIPEKNWVAVFTQGFNTKLYKLSGIPEPQLNRTSCIIGGHSYKFATYAGPLSQDVVLCDLNSGPSDGLRVGDTVTVLLESKKALPSVARTAGDPIYNMCVFTQIKDQARYVRDWVDYHRRIGADHFFISDNNSTDQLETMFENDPEVQIPYWPFKKLQAQAYIFGRLALESRCHWVMFMDLDQYIFINDTTFDGQTLGGTVKRVLETSPKTDQICLYGKVYGSSGHMRIPSARIPEVYIHTNLTGVDNQIWQRMPNCMIRTSSAGLDTVIQRFLFPSETGNQREITITKNDAYFNHYSVRSFEDFIQKFEGRNGLVADWGLKRDRTPIDLDHPDKAFVSGMRGANEDTAFKDVYRKIMADRTLPEPPTYVPYIPHHEFIS